MVTPGAAAPEIPVLVALDLPTAEEAVRIAKRVLPYVGGFKIGLGLLHGPGPATVSALVDLGKPVFVDAKLHDIPSQVGAAARRLGRLGTRWMTAHISGGPAMVAAAVEGLGETSDGAAGVLGVSVLTSLDEAALTSVGITESPGRLVSKMAKVAAASGCEGVVCSPRELNVVATVAPTMLRVTPGIRPGGSGAGDQRRIATPEEAMRRGAHILVVGRAITAAQDPASSAAMIAQSLLELAVDAEEEVVQT
jgi:orotidine-5'-phosphate decarboxylase